ncbi:MAG: 2-C-methyl-D-erythritol 4-phosphate cytidylyltransferase [Candidatus Omnitrophota bacterium]|nr:2-C-methyl-D-erythritol 4-phosphate cytidylyltransferase [Candidatus Omnitrophota bacterium]
MKNTSFKVGVVVVCAGKGKRLGRKVDKAILNLKGKPLFYHTFKTFQNIKEIKEIVLVLRRKHFNLAKRLIKDKRVKLAKGGYERKDSVYNGLSVLNKSIDYVLIHDGARPFVDKKIIRRLLRELKKYPAVICGIRPKDTVKLINGKFIKKTLDREKLFLVQTPQGFKKVLLLKAYSKLKNRKVFDDAQVLELVGEKVKIVEGEASNIKITYPQDILLAKAILQAKGA